MAAALGGLGLLRGRLRLRLGAAAASPPSSSSSSSSSPLGRGAAARAAAGRSYGSEAKEEEELRVRYLDDEHKGGHGNRYCLLIKEKNKGLEHAVPLLHQDAYSIQAAGVSFTLLSLTAYPSPAAHDADLAKWDPSATAPLRSSTSCFLTACRDRPCLPRLPFKASPCSLMLL